MSDVVTIEEMKPKLLTLDDAKARLAKTEPLSSVKFPLYGDDELHAKFRLVPGWNSVDKLDTAPVDAFVTVGGKEYQLTKDALLEATSYIGLTKGYVKKTPAHLIEANLNYWFANWEDHEMKMLVNDSDQGLALTKGSISPFSNLELLDRAVTSIREKYGFDSEVLVDYKFFHDLRRTNVRLIVPSYVRNPREDDPWSLGISLRNSTIAQAGVSTELQGYLFRWWCTNGATSTHATSGTWNRRTRGQSEDVYDWAKESVDEILGHLDHEFEAIEELANTPIETDADGNPVIDQVLEDVFTQYGVPARARDAVIDNMVNSDDLTMYGVMNAVTQAANTDDISETMREALLQVGGDIPRAASQRCQTCRRIQV